MMKRIVILLGLMLLFRAGIHGQVCNDTLIWKVDLQYLGIIAPTGTPLNGYSKTIFKDMPPSEDYESYSFSVKYFGTQVERFENNTVRLRGGRNLEVLLDDDEWMLIPDESHIVEGNLGYFSFHGENEYEFGFSWSLCFSCQIKNYGLSLPAQLRMITYIDSSSLEGKFCDSIVRLSADTAYFSMIDGDTLINKISAIGQEHISVFPNPAQSQITVTDVQGAVLHLYNILGQEIVYLRNEQENAIINTSHLPQGLYVLKVEKENAVLTRKIQIMR